MSQDNKNDKMSDSEKAKEDWMNKKWRPAMGWMYMMVCVFDFVLFPILWAIVQFWETQAANDAFRQWNPLTLQGAGLFHMAMGAVLGLAAWGRTQEKMNGANMPPASVLPPSSQTVTTTYGAPAPQPQAPMYSQPAYSQPMQQPAVSKGGYKMAPQQDDPVI